MPTTTPSNELSWRLSHNRRLVFVVNDPAFFVSHRLPLGMALRRAGWEITVATPLGAGVETIQRMGFSHEPLRSLDRWGMNPIGEARSVAELTSLYQRLRPVIVHHVTIKPVLQDRKSTRLNSSHIQKSRMPSSA